MFELALSALADTFALDRLPYLGIGIMLGLALGLLPGLGGTVAMSILLPFVFGMDAPYAISMMIGFIAVGHTSDTFPGVLFGVPGSGGSQATIMDGYPLARQGRAGFALGASFSASMIGGVIGALALFGIIQVGRPLVLSMASPELLMLCILGLSMVGLLARGAMLAGVGAVFLGLALGSIGASPGRPEYRYTFDWGYLYDGIPLPIIALGLFAIPELIRLLTVNVSISGGMSLAKGDVLRGFKETLKHKRLVLQGSLMGSFIGILPGLGGSVVDWIAYGLGDRTSRKNNKFGRGDIRGVIAPESANNAKEGGSLVPTLMFGIPGSGTTAILLGGLMMVGIQVGPSMVTEQLDVTLSIIWLLIAANIVAALVCAVLARYVAKMSTMPPWILCPMLIVLIVAAAYQTTGRWGDIWLMLGLGVVAHWMRTAGISRAPILIGFVLSTSVERYLHLSISGYGAAWLMRPGVIVIGLFILLLFAGIAVESLRRRPKRERVVT